MVYTLLDCNTECSLVLEKQACLKLNCCHRACMEVIKPNQVEIVHRMCCSILNHMSLTSSIFVLRHALFFTLAKTTACLKMRINTGGATFWRFSHPLVSGNNG